VSDGVRLIVFDLGRVLVRICDNWQHACEVAGLVRPPDIDPSQAAQLHELVCANEVGEMDNADFLAAAAPLLGIPLEHMSALSDAYVLGPYPGAVELLKELQHAGFTTACLSNTNVNHWRLMTDETGALVDILTHLKHPFASHRVGLRKPDPRIYQHVEKETGVAPQQIVFFDDLAENIAAAHQRGWHGHRIDVGPDPIAQIRAHLANYSVAPAR
jgi:putative hydrolase of the HAD superfamily